MRNRYISAPMLTVDDILRLLRKECDRAGSVRAWADAHDISEIYVGQVLRGDRTAGPKILEALCLERVYRKVPPKRRKK